MEDTAAIIVLAAGASVRFGTPKQNLLFKQTTLLQYSINAALASKAGCVLVIVGTETGSAKTSTSNHRLQFLINDQWKEGMASSIRCGIQYVVTNKPSVNSALLMACDQPFVDTGLLDKLVTLQQETGSAIVACRYGDTQGIPAIFARQLFPELLQLTGDSGAKKMIVKYKASSTVVNFPQGIIDIDTPEDYRAIQNNERK